MFINKRTKLAMKILSLVCKQFILAILLFTSSSLVKAQLKSNSTDTIVLNNKHKIDEVLVSAQRISTKYSKVAQVVRIITKEEIKLSPAQSIQELLEYAASVDIRQRGAHGVQADISMRGGSFDQTMILLNGVNITDPQTGHLSLNLPINIDDIERIEILKGAGSRVFGPNAFSGAINFISSIKKTNAIRFKAYAGEHGLNSASVGANVSTGNLNSYISVSRKSSDGYIKNTDFKNANFFYQAKYENKKGEYDFQLGYNEKEYGANSFYTPKYPNQFEATNTTFTSFRYTNKGKLKFTPLVYWRRHNDRFELFRNNPASWYKTHNYHMSDVVGSSLNMSFSSKLGKTSTGIEYRLENIFSNVLGEDLHNKKKVPGENDKYFTKQSRRDNISYFIEHNVSLDKFTLSAGVLLNWNSVLEDDINLYPGIDISYQACEELKYYFSFNKSLRMPSFTELYYVGPTNIGNINLKPEKSTNYETGLKYSNYYLNSNLSLFLREGNDILDWVKSDASDKWQAQNITKINTKGIEISSSINMSNLINEDFFVKQISMAYTFIDMDKESSEQISKYALDQLKHKLNISINHSIYKSLSLSWKASWQDRSGGFVFYSTDEDKNGENISYKPFWTLDTKLYWQANKYNIFLEASNIMDYKYYDLGNIPQSGRWIRAGVQINL